MGDRDDHNLGFIETIKDAERKSPQDVPVVTIVDAGPPMRRRDDDGESTLDSGQKFIAQARCCFVVLVGGAV